MSIRLKRLNELFRRDLGEIIQRSFQPDGSFVTITKVKLSPDLSIAKVYLSVFSPNRDSKTIYTYLDDQQKQIKHALATRIRNQVRKIPELHFYEDDTSEYVDSIEQLFKKIDKK